MIAAQHGTEAASSGTRDRARCSKFKSNREWALTINLMVITIVG